MPVPDISTPGVRDLSDSDAAKEVCQVSLHIEDISKLPALFDFVKECASYCRKSRKRAGAHLQMTHGVTQVCNRDTRPFTFALSFLAAN